MANDRWHQVTEIFHAAAELTDRAAREAYLADVCLGDRSLRAEVEALLAGHDEAGSLGERPLAAERSANHLSSGTRLGPHEIVRLVGAGGMGEVYEARDTRLDRVVAVKVLPAEFGNDPERRTRFVREAKTIAKLNHPHICTLYDVGRDADTDYLVMELLEGETLADRLNEGPLPIDEALRYGAEIADALATAHRAGVVHRDLKPGNIMLTKAGAKLLDFGLAKLKPPVGAAEATTEREVTAEGAIVGTVQYMAPEQLEGRDIDARTDIFAFGAVLYEMLTGQRAFAGESQASLIGAILKDEPPPLTATQPRASRALAHVVEECLRKSPEDRWQAADDVARELRWVEAAGVSGDALPMAGKRKSQTATANLPWWRRPVPLLLVVVAIGVSSGLAVWIGTESTSLAADRYEFALPPGDRFRRTGHLGVAWTPDGTTVVYTAEREGVSHLFRRSRLELDPVVIPGTEGVLSNPAVSPDGRWVTFMASGSVKLVPLEGGPSFSLVDVRPAVLRGFAWEAPGTIVYGTQPTGLFRVSVNGGPSQPVTLTEQHGHRFPAPLPDGRGTLFTVGDLGSMEVVVLPAGQDEWRPLVAGTSPAYLPTGHLIFYRDGSIWAAPFDLDSLGVVGEPIPVVNGVEETGGAQAGYALADDGSLAYIPAIGESNHTLTWVDPEGNPAPLNARSQEYSRVDLSPDGTEAVVRVLGSPTRLWVYEIKRNMWHPLTSDPATEWDAIWTPDGTQVVFMSRREGPFSIHIGRADGSSEPMPLGISGYPRDWTPDGRGLIYGADDRRSLRTWWFDGRESEELLRVASGAIGGAQVSPDGHLLTYELREGSASQIVVRPYPDVEANRWVIFEDGGTNPKWSPDGKLVFYWTGSEVMSTRVDFDGEVTFGDPEPMFSGSYGNLYDVAPDGRFLMVEQAPFVGGDRIVVITNWFAQLLEKVPVR